MGHLSSHKVSWASCGTNRSVVRLRLADESVNRRLMASRASFLVSTSKTRVIKPDRILPIQFPISLACFALCPNAWAFSGQSIPCRQIRSASRGVGTL